MSCLSRALMNYYSCEVVFIIVLSKLMIEGLGDIFSLLLRFLSKSLQV